MKQIGPAAKTDEVELSGVIGDDPKDARIAELEHQVRGAIRQRDDAILDARRAQEDANRALGMLRTQLGPLYRALQAVFGELDAAGVTDAGPGPVTYQDGPTSAAPKNVAVWDAWKAKLPPAVGKVIDALLTHGELSQAQIKVAAQMGTSTVSDSVYKLNKVGLIEKNGGKVRLKAL